ncbi:hypothetical protein CR970_04410 [Candidatus Saccharibacteria bacterium]|nr:MAG: hypothetical protein CR970_04410 [Candidatus Saccharibacteria bacterium]
MHNKGMPSRNIVKRYDVNSYYHLYTRGVNKQPIFISDADYAVFTSLFKRYLSPETVRSTQRIAYKNYSDRCKLIAYALMPNHIHMFVYQSEQSAIPELMRSILTSYSMYFNKTHHRTGPLFQSRYLASPVNDDAYFTHITRYIHMNPRNWRDSDHTSLPYFIGRKRASWIHPEEALDTSPESYLEFLNSYEERRAELDDIKWELANAQIDSD